MPNGYFPVLARRRWSVAAKVFTVVLLAGFVVLSRADESRARLPQHAGTPPHSTSHGLRSSSTLKDQAKIGARAPGLAVLVDPGAKRVSPLPPGALANVRLIEGYGKLPLSFEPNRGQTDPKVKFLSRGPGYGLFLTSSEAVLTLRRGHSRDEKIKGQLNDPRLRDADAKAQNESVLRLKLVGANPSSNVNGLDELPGKSNYFIGNDRQAWRTDVPNFARVQYHDVYPGVDLVYYGNQRQLEYDWVVKPGADLKTIRMDVAGASLASDQAGPPRGASLRIDASGDLVIQTEGGEVRFQKPVVYQLEEGRQLSVVSSQLKETRHALDGRYVLRGRRDVGFEVASYDHRKPLIIDPVLSYSTYLGGTANDQAGGIAVDATGNAFVVGDTASADFPYVLGLPAPNNAFQGVRDVFVTKLNATGTALIYSTYLGGSANDLGSAIAIDAAGNAYVTGTTFSLNFPVSSRTVFQIAADVGTCTSVCQGDAFATKLNATGNALLYSTYLGGTGSDQGLGIAIDAASTPNIYVTGSTRSSTFPITRLNAFQSTCPTCGTTQAVFISKLAPLGGGASDLVYSSFLGGGANDQGNAIVVDGASNAYVTGFTASAFPTTAGTFQTVNKGLEDAFVAKFNPSAATGPASLVYSTLLGGAGNDEGKAIAVDLTGNAYVTGLTQSASTPTPFPLKNPLQQFLNGTQNAFVTKLHPTGSALIFSTYLGGSQSDAGMGIAVDSGANVFLTGFTSSLNFPVTSNAVQSFADLGTCPVGPCKGDGFVTKLNAAGSAIIFSTYLGGSSSDSASAIAIDSPGNAYVTGYTQSTNFPTTTGVFQTVVDKGACSIAPCPQDAFVAKLTGLALPVARLTPPSLAFGSITVGASSAPQDATLSNLGDATLNISSIAILAGIDIFSPSPDYSQTNTCGPTLAPGASCAVSITFSPRTGGSKPAFLKVTDDAAGGSQRVDLSGTGVVVGPLVSLSPTSLNFGKQLVGTTSVAQTVTLQNTGVSNLIISSIVPSADYTSASTCPISPAVLAPSGTCTITVTFAPKVTGPNLGTIKVTDNAPFSPQQVILTGTGVAPVPLINQPPVPTATLAGGLPFTLTVNGTGFVSGSTVKWDGSARATTFINSTRLTAAILAADIATQRTASLTVVNPGPAFSTSNVIFFPVTSPTPTVTFGAAPGSPLAVGTFNQEVVVGDFNGDGKQDLAVTNSSSSTVTVLLGNGDGTFTPVLPPVSTGKSTGPRALAVGDFNGDGKLDLAVSNQLTNSITILLGDGNGNFTPVAQTPAACCNPVSIAVGDFDGDGKLDLAVTGAQSTRLTILMGNGDGTFTPKPLPPATGSQPGYVLMGDFNGDGKPDLAVANFLSNDLTILLGNGDGTFAPTARPPTALGGPGFLAAGDFNGDGKLDLAVLNYNTFNVTILLGDGTGNFTPTALSPATRDSANSLAIGDFNGDGKLDLAVLNFNASTITLLLGDGTGNFATNPQSPATARNPNFVAAGDFNGDGRLDLAVANGSVDTVSILLQVPLVTISPASLTFGNQNFATVSPAQTVTITNNGSAPLKVSSVTVTGANPSDFTKSSDTCTGVALAPGSSCITGATFSPTAPGARTAAFTITDNAGGSPHTVPLSGTGVVPVVTLSSASLTFARRLVGTTSAPQPVTLTNSGNGVLPITSISPTDDYAQTNNCGAALPPGGNCVINITFTPVGTDSRPGSITITSVAPGSPHVIVLAGSAYAPVPLINQPLVPAAVVPGAYQTILTVNGTGFVKGSVVQLNGITQSTTFVSSTKLNAPYNGSPTVTTVAVRVQSPGPAFSTSNVVFLPVTRPSPSVAFTNAPGSPLAAVGGPFWAAVGDFNGDGKPDLAVVNNASNTVSILLSNGDGTFQPALNSATGTGPSSVSVGDFNGDGRLDLAVSNNPSGTVSVLLGKGDGTFLPAVNYTTGSAADSVAVGDFNGDGKLDLAVANWNGLGSISVLLGKGDGTFQAAVNYGAGPGNPVSLKVADFNGDGKLDLVMANNSFDQVGVLLGNGDGTFLPAVQFPAGRNPVDIAVGDFNNDGKLDLIVANNVPLGTASVLLGNGDGTFQAPVSYAAGASARAVAVGDFDGDGILDLALANTGSNNVSLLIGNGNGTFQAATNFPAGSGPYSLAVVDFNNDGRLDLAVANLNANTLSILLQAQVISLSTSNLNLGNVPVGGTITQTLTVTNTGGGTLLVSSIVPSGGFLVSDNCKGAIPPGGTCTIKINLQPTATGTRAGSVTINSNGTNGPQTVSLSATAVPPVYLFNRADFLTGTAPQGEATGDFNVDGRADLAIVNSGSRTVSILLGKPDGTFAPKVDYPTGPKPAWVVVGDFNSDGKADLAVTNSGNNTVSVLLGNGDGTFQAQVTYATGPRPLRLATGDFNADGKIDLAVVDQNCDAQGFACAPAGSVSILLGNGDGTFKAPVDYAVGQAPVAIALADFNGDGKLDLAITNKRSFAVSILLGNGDGTFKAQTQLFVSGTSTAIASGDFNGDGKADLAVFLESEGTFISILLGNGDGSFMLPLDTPVNYSGAAVTTIVVSDFNGDGKQDLSFANNRSASISVLLGIGDGTFQPSVDYAVGDGPVGLVIADFNGDGKLDFAATNTTSNTATILLGNGDGTFSPKKDFAAGLDPVKVAFGDFNADGKLDMAVGNDNSNFVSVFLGNGDGTFKPHVDYATGVSPRFVTVGDFNGDGKLDLAVTNENASTVSGPHTVSVFLGNGDGTFQPQVQYPTGVIDEPDDLTTGDFNGDGKTDLAVANDTNASGGGDVSILLGAGNGSFQPARTYTAKGGEFSIVTGDFNGDGKLDFAVTDEDTNTISIALGKGDGTFAPPVSYPAGNEPLGLAVGDFNGDGKLDIVVANEGTGNDGYTILLGNGDGTFKARFERLFLSAGPQSVTVGDFNGDGIPDLALVSAANLLSVLLGVGDGTFQQRIDFTTGQTPKWVAAGDLNGDARLDLAFSNEGSQTVSSFLNTPVSALFPGGLNFGNQVVGAPSAAQTVTLYNPSAAPLAIARIVASGDYAITNGCGTSLAPGASCALTVTFTPTATGVRLGTIIANDNDTGVIGSTQVVNLAGTGVVPLAGLAPASLPFANQLVGTTSAPSTATLINTGTAPLTIANIAASGDFAQSNNCGTSLAATASCTITVTFIPTAAGARTGAVTVTDNHNGVNGSTQTVTLTGTGIVPVAAVSPGTLNFVDQPVGTTSAAQFVTLTNSGGAPLRITSIAPSGDFAVSDNCAGSVAPGASCVLSVTFTPTATGTRSGSITITDSAAGSPRTITLSGTASGAQLSLSATGLQLPDTHVNQRCTPRTVTLTNSGATPVTISGIAISGQFAQTNNCPVGPATLAPGGSCLVTVTFVPTTVGQQSGTLTVTSNAASSPNTVALAGNGKIACLVVPAASTLTVIRGADTAIFSLKHQTEGGAAEDPLHMYCTSQAPTSCAFDPGLVGPMGTSTLTLSNLKAVHAGLLMFDVHGDAGLDKHTTGLTVLISDFTFSSAPDTASVAAGQSTSFALVAAPQNGLQGTLSLSCSGAPAGATCAVSPSAITLTGTAPVSVTVTVSTTARSLAPPGTSRRVLPLGGNPIGLVVLVMLGLMASLAAAKFGAQKSRSLGSISSMRLRLATLGTGLTMAMVLAWGACGDGSFSVPPASTLNATPAGTYNLTVTGTYTGAPGTNAQLSHSATLKLTVN